MTITPATLERRRQDIDVEAGDLRKRLATATSVGQIASIEERLVALEREQRALAARRPAAVAEMRRQGEQAEAERLAAAQAVLDTLYAKADDLFDDILERCDALVELRLAALAAGAPSKVGPWSADADRTWVWSFEHLDRFALQVRGTWRADVMPGVERRNAARSSR